MDDKTKEYLKLTGKKELTERIIFKIDKIKVEGSLMIWWIPQVPMKSFLFPVNDIKEAKQILSCLAKYDLFQYENKVKGDYSNTGGLLVFEDKEWIDWTDPSTGDNIDDIDLENDFK